MDSKAFLWCVGLHPQYSLLKLDQIEMVFPPFLATGYHIMVVTSSSNYKKGLPEMQVGVLFLHTS